MGAQPREGSVGGGVRPWRWRSVALVAVVALTAAVAVFFQGSGAGARGPLSLNELPLSDAKGAGERLMSLPIGRHRITRGGWGGEGVGGEGARAVMAHGYESRGYEWVYALHEAARRWGEVWFVRWDWRQCPHEAGEGLRAHLEALSRGGPGRPLIALGHSYGGVALALAARDYTGAAPLSAHIIAAPLAGHPALESRCPPPSIDARLRAPLSPASALRRGGVTLTQWRTQVDLDGAFSSLERDPQLTDALPLTARALGREYKGQRLGHNWSVSAVIDLLLGELGP